MTDLLRLKEILKEQIDWYNKMKPLEINGTIDDSYIYDECIEQFSSLKRGDYLEMLEILQ